jgi:alpha-N-arabinofuranosidase
MTNLLKPTLLLFALSATTFSHSEEAAAAPHDNAVELTFSVEDTVLNTIDPLIFGQFMEIASWGEPGPEAMVDPDSGRLPEDIVELLKQLHAPIVRFPGGTDIDYFDWTDRIDGVPGRAGDARPVSERNDNQITNHFGYDEFLALAEELETEPLLVLNLRDSFVPGADVVQEAQHVAGLLAYCNGRPEDERLSEEMRAWAELRVANGRPEPWGVTYWQVGNEIWLIFRRQADELGLSDDPAELARFYVDRLIAYAEALREVDPQIKLICDGHYPTEELKGYVLADPRLGEHYDYLNVHTYAPGGSVRYLRHGEPVDVDNLSRGALWYAWVSMPASIQDGEVIAKDEVEILPAMAGVSGALSITEWNWNGWGSGINEQPTLAYNAAGLGAAAYLQGIMRQGEHFRLATQSMMLGVSWGLASIHVEADGEHPPFISPTGAATALYSQFHGPERLRIVSHDPMPAVQQNLTLRGWGEREARSPLPLVDVLATRGDGAVYIHAVQRSLDRPIRIAVDLTELDGFDDAAAIVHALVPRDAEHPGAAPRDAMRRTQWPADVRDGRVVVQLPARSVCVVEVRR